MYYKLAYQNRFNVSPILIIAVVVVFTCLSAVLFTEFGKKTTNSINQKSTVIRFDIVGVTNNSISLYWRTATDVIPSVSYSINEKTDYRTIFDVRETEDSQTARRNHLITIESLNPATTYYFKIDGITSVSKSPMQFSVKTASKVASTSSHPVYGKLIDGSGKPVDEAVVLVKFKDAYPLVTLSKNDGTFLASTCCIIDNKTLENKTVSDTDEVTIEVIDEEGNQLIFKDYLASISPLANPLSFTNGAKTIDNRTKQQAHVVPTLVLGVTAPPQQSKNTFSVIYPLNQNVIPLGSPLLKGTGVVGKTVYLSLKKTNIATSITIDANGLWQGQFAHRLAAGQYELIADSVDASSKKVSISRLFTIAKSGEQVLGAATGSATLTPTITGSATLTPTVTSATTPTVFVYATSTPMPPVTGEFNFSTIVLLSIALIATGAGIILIF